MMRELITPDTRVTEGGLVTRFQWEENTRKIGVTIIGGIDKIIDRRQWELFNPDQTVAARISKLEFDEPSVFWTNIVDPNGKTSHADAFHTLDAAQFWIATKLLPRMIEPRSR